MQVPRWRNLLIIKNTVFPAFVKKTQMGYFHSTSALCDKWKNKWTPDVRDSQQPSKSYARFAVRQKRADTKKALKNLLFNNGCKFNAKDERDRKIVGESAWDTDQQDQSDYSKNTSRPKFSSRHAKKTHNHKMKRKHKKGYYSEDCDNPDTTFKARFGNKWYTWSSHSTEDFFRSSAEFDWREQQSHGRNNKWSGPEYESDNDSYTSYTVGSSSDRLTLGLPSTGPLKIQEVKDAFRVSALKYHPDKHQGPTQAVAEEKFKLCVDAYKSLCSYKSVKWYTWSSHSTEDFFRSSAEFDWREQQSHGRNNKWSGPEYESDNDSYTSYTVGSSSDRLTLGLPSTGPLKIQEVKDAFRVSALKYHPDKHQGPTQAVAEEKFKLCVDAYKSLCSALSST